MTGTVSLEQAQGNLKELIEKLAPGDELVITEGNQPIAKLTSEPRKPGEFRKPGFGKGMITIINDDDSHLDDFGAFASQVDDSLLVRPVTDSKEIAV